MNHSFSKTRKAFVSTSKYDILSDLEHTHLLTTSIYGSVWYVCYVSGSVLSRVQYTQILKAPLYILKQINITITHTFMSHIGTVGSMKS